MYTAGTTDIAVLVALRPSTDGPVYKAISTASIDRFISANSSGKAPPTKHMKAARVHPIDDDNPDVLYIEAFVSVGDVSESKNGSCSNSSGVRSVGVRLCRSLSLEVKRCLASLGRAVSDCQSQNDRILLRVPIDDVFLLSKDPGFKYTEEKVCRGCILLAPLRSYVASPREIPSEGRRMTDYTTVHVSSPFNTAAEATIPAVHYVKSFSVPLKDSVFLSRSLQGACQSYRPSVNTTLFSNMLVESKQGRTTTLFLVRDDTPSNDRRMFMFDDSSQTFHELKRYEHDSALKLDVDELFEVLFDSEACFDASEWMKTTFSSSLGEKSLVKDCLSCLSISCTLGAKTKEYFSRCVHVDDQKIEVLKQILSKYASDLLTLIRMLTKQSEDGLCIPRKLWVAVLSKCIEYSNLLVELPLLESSYYSDVLDTIVALSVVVADNQVAGFRASLEDDIATEDWSSNNDFRRGKKFSHGALYFTLSIASLVHDTALQVFENHPLYTHYVCSCLLAAVEAIFPAYYLSIRPSRTRHKQLICDLHYILATLCHLAARIEDITAVVDDLIYKFVCYRLLIRLSEALVQLYLLCASVEDIVKAFNSIIASGSQEDDIVIEAPPRTFHEVSAYLETICTGTFEPVPTFSSLVRFASSMPNRCRDELVVSGLSLDVLYALKVRWKPRWLKMVISMRYELIGDDDTGYPELNGEQVTSRRELKALCNSIVLIE